MAENELKVPTPYGDIDIQLYNTTQAGEVFTIKGKGFPSIRGGYTGNFLVKVNLIIPKMNSKERSNVIEASKGVKDKVFDKWRKRF